MSDMEADCGPGTYWNTVTKVCASCLELCQETMGDAPAIKLCCPSLVNC